MKRFHSDALTIQVDTREHQKEWERIQKQFDSIGVKYFRSKLYVGDYMSLDNPRLIIDRKKDLLEVITDVTQQHERFKNELLRAEQAGIQLILLIEDQHIHTLEDVYFWENPRSKIMDIQIIDGKPARVQKYPKATTGQSLYRCMLTIANRYRIEWEFCNKRQTGKRIIELLETKHG